MRLSEVIDAYIAMKTSLGMSFDSARRLLRQFSREIGNPAIGEVQAEAVATFLGVAASEAPPLANVCPAGKAPISGSAASNWNGWSPTLDNARYVPTEKGGVSIGQMRNLKLKWAFGFPGDITAFSLPGKIWGAPSQGLIKSKSRNS